MASGFDSAVVQHTQTTTDGNAYMQTDAVLQQRRSDEPGQPAVFTTNQAPCNNGEITPKLLTTGKQSEWQEVKSKNKRPRSSPEDNNMRRNSKQTRIADYWLDAPVNIANKYKYLDNQESEESESIDTAKPVKAPPIFISGVNNISPLMNMLNLTAKDNFTIKVQSQEQVKVQAKTIEAYDVIIKSLKEKNTEYHTYQKKQEKPFRVILRNMHYSTEIDSIKKEIESHGHTVLNIINMRQRITKKPLPLFSVDLKPDENNKSIYTTEYLLNTKIKFEAPHFKREIPQCTNCQRYGHTKNFCFHPPRCVKCTGNHRTSDCLYKERSDKVKCVLCGGNHPASYKGCTIYKQLQKAKFPTLRNKEIALKQKATEQIVLPSKSLEQSKPNHPGLTYAQVAADRKTQGHSSNNPASNHQVQGHQSDGLQELKSMMKGLMEQMSIMLNLLTTLVSKMSQ